MSNRRFEMFELRNILVRMRQGDSDRSLARAGLIGRDKARELRQLAAEAGWLDPASPLPDNAQLGQVLMPPTPAVQRSASCVEPYRPQVEAWAAQGIQSSTIYQALQRNHQFRGSYSSVYRFVRQLAPPSVKATVQLEFAPGEAAQVDFGSGPMLLDTRTGQARNQQAITSKMAYTDFLSLLISDEVARREQKKFDLRLRRAAFRSTKTLEQFDFDFNPKINATLIHDLMTCRFIQEKVAVLIVGPCGTGKSHIAQAIGHAAVKLDCDVLFTSAAQLLSSLYAARAHDHYERRFKYLCQLDLLIIDDFGLKPLRSPADEDFHDLMAERYERKATVVTSNLDFSEWGDAFPNKLLGAATLDRLKHGAYRLILDGKSYRKPRPLQDGVEKTKKEVNT